MSAQLHLARPADLERLLPLVEAFHDEAGLALDPAQRANAIAPLLEGSPHGAVYLLGPARAPLGYIVVTFGWSVEFGGLDAMIDEIYIRPAVRRRGIATEALGSLAQALARAGVRALHLEVARENEALQRLYTRARFELRDRFALMSRAL